MKKIFAILFFSSIIECGIINNGLIYEKIDEMFYSIQENRHRFHLQTSKKEIKSHNFGTCQKLIGEIKIVIFNIRQDMDLLNTRGVEHMKKSLKKLESYAYLLSCRMTILQRRRERAADVEDDSGIEFAWIYDEDTSNFDSE